VKTIKRSFEIQRSYSTLLRDTDCLLSRDSFLRIVSSELRSLVEKQRAAQMTAAAIEEWKDKIPLLSTQQRIRDRSGGLTTTEVRGKVCETETGDTV
jgi:hypothetical protein